MPLDSRYEPQSERTPSLPFPVFDDPLFGISFGELLQADLPHSDDVICHLGRGEVGSIVSPTNRGKTTFSRNLGLSASVGREFGPFKTPGPPLRVAYFDFETSWPKIETDISFMLDRLTSAEKQMAATNLILFGRHVDSAKDPLSFSNKVHREQVLERLIMKRVDLIIVDTVTRAFRICDENNNAEIQNEVLNPLQQIAERCNAAVLYTHHVGKSGLEHGRNQLPVHLARGASSFVDRCTLVLSIQAAKAKGSIKVHFAKTKGDDVDPALLFLDPTTRWFRSDRDRLDESDNPTLAIFIENRDYETSEIISKLAGSRARSTVMSDLKCLKDAGLLVQIKRGVFRRSGV